MRWKSVVGGRFVFLFTLLLCSLIGLSFLGPSPGRSSSSPVHGFLTSDAHVVVGDVPLLLPFIALPDRVSMGSFLALDRAGAGEDWRRARAAFRAAASDPGTAPAVDLLAVNIFTYGWIGETASVETICPKLNRKWARSVCDNPWAPLRRALPENPFYLVDDRKMDAFDQHLTVGYERVSDHLRAMDLRAGSVSVVCDRTPATTPRFCTAAMTVDRHLAAVWTVWDEEGESAARMAARQGRAVRAFVRHALGPREDFRTLTAVACAARRLEDSATAPCGALAPSRKR